MNFSTYGESAAEFAFLTLARLRRLAFLTCFAVGLYPHLAHSTGVKVGPFEIQFRFERSWGGGPSMNPLASYKHARYKLLHNGRAVSFSPTSTNGATRDWFAGDLLEAHYLQSNGLPVVLVCTETGTYLVNEVGGKPFVQHLHGTPATRFQFLDSEAGQPGELQAFNAGPDSAQMGRDVGKSGTLMLLPELNGILDLNTLKFQIYEVLKSHQWVYNDPDFNGYSFDPSPTGQARVWWPNRKQFALVRYKYVGDFKSFAFELVNLNTDSKYAVPFDLEKTRLTALGDITPAWVNHYFQWNGDRLSANIDATSLPWLGSLKSVGYSSFHFDLQPISVEMRAVFLKFLVDKFGAIAQDSTEISNSVGLSIQNQSFKLRYYDTGKVLVLEPALDDPKKLTMQIAEQFNLELALGKYQGLFTAFGPQGFSQ